MSTKKTTTLVETTTSGTGRKAGSTDAILAYRAQRAELARVWNALPTSAKNGFQKLAAQSNPPLANGKPRVTAFFFFANCNTALVNAGSEPILTAPDAPVYPDMLPTQVVLLSALSNSPRNPFSLTIQCAAYPGIVVLYAAPPVMADTNNYKASAFKMIGYVPSIPDGGADIAGLYAAEYGIPQPGEKIAIQMMGVSEAGYTTKKQFASAVTTTEVAAVANTDDTDTDDAALKLA